MVSLLSWCFIPYKIKFWLALILLHLQVLSDFNLQSSFYTSVSPGVLMTGFMDLTRKMLFINVAVQDILKHCVAFSAVPLYAVSSCLFLRALGYNYMAVHAFAGPELLPTYVQNSSTLQKPEALRNHRTVSNKISWAVLQWLKTVCSFTALDEGFKLPC